jgi:hypothetical protein
MAGIYSRESTEFDTAEKDPVNFAILMTKANEAVVHIHDRMPAIVAPAERNGNVHVPPLAAEMPTSYPVTPKMNRASFNEPAAITTSRGVYCLATRYRRIHGASREQSLPQYVSSVRGRSSHEYLSRRAH